MKDPISAIPFKLPNLFPASPQIKAVEEASNHTYGKLPSSASAHTPKPTQPKSGQITRNIEQGKGGLCDLIG